MESARERRWRLKSPLSFRQPQTPSSVDGTCHWFTLVVTIVCVHEVLALHELTVKLKHRLGRDSVSILENARERTLPSSQRSIPTVLRPDNNSEELSIAGIGSNTVPDVA